MDIVDRLSSLLRERVGANRYDLWFTSSVRLTVHGSVVRVTSATEFTLSALAKSFRDDLEFVAKSLLGEAATLEFERDATIAAPVRQPSLEAAAPTVSTESPRPEKAEKTAKRGRLPSTFGDYVVGEGNRLAFNSLRMTLERPGQVSPLVLHGPNGVGKTHLLEALAHAARKQTHLRRAVMISAEHFTTYFVEAVRGGTGLPSFRRKYRETDLLLIDDVQFFLGKKATITEVVYTLDTLLRAGKQVVLSADRAPADLAGLGPEFQARLTGGLACNVEHAGFETRLGILRQMATTLCPTATSEALAYIAEKFSGDARELRGALNRVAAHQMALGTPVTGENVAQVLADLVRPANRSVRLLDVERAVCDVFELSPEQLRSDTKVKQITAPRMLAMWLARKVTRAGLAEIGRHFGRRSHSTVVSAQQNVERWLANNVELQLAQHCCGAQEAVRRVELRLRTG